MKRNTKRLPAIRKGEIIAIGGHVKDQSLLLIVKRSLRKLTLINFGVFTMLCHGTQNKKNKLLISKRSYASRLRQENGVRCLHLN